jgi:hypothetical protein
VRTAPTSAGYRAAISCFGAKRTYYGPLRGALHCANCSTAYGAPKARHYVFRHFAYLNGRTHVPPSPETAQGGGHFADRRTMSSMPSICGRRASDASRSIANSSLASRSAGYPRHDPDRRCGLDRMHGGIESLMPFVDCHFAFPAELPDPSGTHDPLSPSRQRARPRHLNYTLDAKTCCRLGLLPAIQSVLAQKSC